MANFIDVQPNFNPYVQQLPVEAMTKVGLELQRRYDEGVQRIQQSIDKVAGLDIVRPQDKAYLQNKLNSFGNKLRFVSAGDFSNYQLVNTISGMASDVGKDPNVSNAVSSSAWYRKQASRIQQDEDAGKANPANIMHFQKRANAWMENPDVGAKFSDSYVEYFDVDKHVRETFNALKPDGYTIDEVFQTDKDGKRLVETYVDPATGEKRQQYVLSTSMTRLKKEGIFPKKVQETLDQIFSDPRVDRQLQITGEYNYGQVAPQKLADRLYRTEVETVNKFNDRIGELNITLASTSSPTEREAIQEEIEKYKSTAKNVKDHYASLYETLSSNPDYVRGLLHKEETKSRYTGMYTSVSEESTKHENPEWRAQFDMQKEANDIKYKWASLKQADEHFQLNYELEKEKLKLEKAKTGRTGTRGTSTPGIPTMPDGSTPQSAGEPSDLDYVGDFDRLYEQAASNFSNATTDLLFASGVMDDKLVNEYMRRMNVSREVAKDVLIQATAKQYGMTPEEYKTKWFLKAMEQLNKNPNKNLPHIRGIKESAENAQVAFLEIVGEKNKLDRQYPLDDVLKRANPLSYQLAVVYAANKIGASEEIKGLAKKAIKDLEARGISVADAVKKVRNETTITGEIKGTKGSGYLTDFGYELDNIIRVLENPQNVNNLQKRAAIIKESLYVYPHLTETIFTGKKEVDDRYKANLKGMITGYMRADNANLSQDFSSKASDMMVALDGDDVSADITTKKDRASGDITPEVIIYKSGKEIGRLTITPTQATELDFDINSWYQRPEIIKVQEKMIQTKNNTTAYGNILSPETYRKNDVALRKSDIPQLGSSSDIVKVNFQEQLEMDVTGKATSSYYAYIYVNDNGVEGIFPYGGKFSGLDEAVTTMTSLTPAIISQIKKEFQPKK